MLIQYRKHAAMVALILSAVVTPDATMFTMLLMAIPLIILYEIGIWGAKIFGRPPKSKTIDEGVDEPDSDMADETKSS
jgi:sec-independent protein translocase protein TatC